MTDRTYFDRFFEDIGDASPFEAVLRGHLWVEHELMLSLEAAMYVPALADLDRLRYGERVNLVAAHGLMQPDEMGGFKALNRLRNKMAHQLAWDIVEQDETELLNALGKRHRDHVATAKARETSHEFPVGIKYAITAMCISLQMDREAMQAAHRRLRTAAENLIAVAGKRQPAVPPED